MRSMDLRWIPFWPELDNKGRRNVRADELSSTEDFLLHYQLQHDPFAARPPGFRFFTPGRKPVLAQLHHMAHFAEQLQVVVGPSGAGKTLLRQALVASCNRDKVQCVVTSGREYATEDGLQKLICQALGVSDIDDLLERSSQLHATGMQIYLVVDDAHCLQQDALQMLADISQSGRAAPRVFLFAEDSIAEKLESVSMPAERAWLQLVDMPPFTLEETRAYLAQRLEGAGQGIELLDDQQVARIHELSGGWPGAVNEAARQVMLEEVEQDIRPVRSRRSGFPLRSVAALVLVGVGVAIAWMMGGEEPAPTQTVLNLLEPVASVDVTAGTGAAVLQMPGDSSSALERIAEEQDAESTADVEMVSAPAPVAAAARPSAGGELPPPLPMPEPPRVEVPAVVAAPPVPPAGGTAPASPAPTASTPVRESTPVAAAPAAATPATSSAPASRAPAVEVQAAPRASAEPHGAAWYRQRPASQYALQVLGTRSRQAALDFIRAQSGVADMGLFETVHEGQPWYVVTQGAYASRAQAQQGAARLPESLRKQKPWPRSMASIQQSLR